MKTMLDISYGQDPAQKLDLILPEAKTFPLFIYFHGGGLENGDKSGTNAMKKFLAAHGVAVVSANYRMYPAAHYPDFIEDAAAAIDWAFRHIGEYGQCQGVYVGGSSAGGYLSMMLCFDSRYLAKYGLENKIAGYIHDAGQPTTHFNVLRERGIDSRRLIVDEAAPIYHVGVNESYPPMIFLVSDDDMKNRLEQTELVISTLKHFEYDQSKIEMRIMHGKHCAHTDALDEKGESIFGRIVYGFIAAREA